MQKPIVFKPHDRRPYRDPIYGTYPFISRGSIFLVKAADLDDCSGADDLRRIVFILDKNQESFNCIGSYTLRNIVEVLGVDFLIFSVEYVEFLEDIEEFDMLYDMTPRCLPVAV